MTNQTIDVVGTAPFFVAPFLFVFIVIALVVPYPWLLLIAFAVWYLIIRYVPAEAIGRATSQHESES